MGGGGGAVRGEVGGGGGMGLRRECETTKGALTPAIKYPQRHGT